MEEVSVIDALNEGFLNEPSEFITSTATFHLGEVIGHFEALETSKFSITEMIEKHKPLLGRKTHNIEKREPLRHADYRSIREEETKDHQ